MAKEGGTREQLPRKSQTFDVNDRLYTARVRQLYKQSHIGIVASLVNSLILISLLWELVPSAASIIWFSVADGKAREDLKSRCKVMGIFCCRLV